MIDVVQSYAKLSHPCKPLVAARHVQAELLVLPEIHDTAPAAPPPRNVRARLGRERVESLVASYQAGVPTTQLMVEFSLSKTAVLALLRGAGVELRRQPLTSEQVEEARRLYEQGLALATVATRLGLARESVRRALIDAGVAMRPRGGQAAVG